MNIYTDGSFIRVGASRPGFGYGGWAFCHVEERQVVYPKSGGESGDDFANGKMELVAVYEALKYVDEKPATIYCDSEYVVKGFTEWRHSWLKSDFKKGKIKFNDIWRLALKIYQPSLHDIKWLKSHQGEFGNEEADRLAGLAAREKMNA